MNPLADYRPLVEGRNDIRNMPITDTNRVICYNQIIHDDDRNEGDEYFSLTLTVQQESAITPQVDVSSAVVKIVDDIEDGELSNAY